MATAAGTSSTRPNVTSANQMSASASALVAAARLKDLRVGASARALGMTAMLAPAGRSGKASLGRSAPWMRSRRPERW